MGLRGLFRRLSTGNAQPVQVIEHSEALARLTKYIRELHTELADLQVRFANAHEHHIQQHNELETAFKTFRQRVYAWKRWEADNGPAPAAEPERAPLDKAAILRAHRQSHN